MDGRASHRGPATECANRGVRAPSLTASPRETQGHEHARPRPLRGAEFSGPLRE
jgi:hypothetical protein